MKEIRMDWDTYHQELSRSKKQGFSRALWEVCQWLEGKDRLDIIIRGNTEHSYAFICLAKALGREDEISEENKIPVKKEAA